MRHASQKAVTGPERPRPEERQAGRRLRRRLILLLGGLAAVGLVVAAALGARTSLRAPTAVAGDGKAVSFTLDNLRPGGPPVSLADYRGRPLVLNFFASWCVPCRREMPGFEVVHDRIGDRVAFLGVNHQDQRGAALDLIEETGVSYLSGFDPRGTVAAAYGLYGMPTTIFISPAGEVLERRTGEVSEGDLEATIDRLFES